MPAPRYGLEDLLKLMARLRDPERGCPWDAVQDFQSLVPLMLEEACEVADAVEREDFDNLREELGDLLLHVAFYAQLAAEAEHFGFGEVVGDLVEKLLRRHPHVFPDGSLHGVQRRSVDNVDAALASWQAVKRTEASQAARQGTLDGIPPQMSALSRAEKMQRRAAKRGFDWNGADGARAQLDAELAELAAAHGADALEHELGDVLFCCVNLARHLGVAPERALRAANRRFERRFAFMEQRMSERGIAWADSDRPGMERLWSEAKQALGRASPEA